MTEVSSSQAIEARPIRIQEMPAVQARMLLHDQSFLDPNKATEAPLLATGNVDTLAHRNYTLFEAASMRERKASQSTTPFAEKYQKWSDSVVTCFNAEANQQRMNVLKPLLRITNTTVSAADVQQLYDRYLDVGSPSSGVKAFVSDVIARYETGGRYDTVAIARDRDSIKWAAQLFGSTSSEMIDQLITAEMQLLANPTEYLQKLNTTRNTVTAPEKKLMGFIYDKQVDELVHQADKKKFPVEEYEEQIKRTILDPDTDKIIISAGTGAGKTTKIPQYIAKILKPGEKVAVTQPRRLPTENLATTVAKQMGVTLGKEVGYSHGKGRMAEKDTKVLFTVEKSLLIKLSRDKYLTEYNYVMVDEWHERHKDTDMLVSLLQRAQALRKRDGLPPLKIIITSATMDRENLEHQLGSNTKSFEIPGKAYDIKDKFEKKGSPPLTRELVPERAARAALDMVRTRPADRNIVIFLPGEGLIADTEEAIRKLGLPPDVIISRLSGSMTREEQNKTIDVSDGKKHIIISTPVLETSLTVERVDVISSGFVNLPQVDPKTGLYFLPEILHSKKGLQQQRGRTGRESDGEWRFLGTEDEYKALEDHHPAEILRSDISDEILLLKKMKLELNDIDLVDKKQLLSENISRAHRRLKDLGALDEHDDITPIGEKMVDIPLDIHYSRMLVEAGERGCVRDATTIAAVCTQTDLYLRGDLEEKKNRIEAQAEFAVAGSDFISRLRMFKAFEQVGRSELDEVKREKMREKWALEHHLSYRTLQRIEVARADLLDRLDTSGDTGTTDEDTLGRCIYEGFKDNFLTRLPKSAVPAVAAANLPNIYELNGELGVTNAVIDKDSTVDATTATSMYVVTAGNYPRQRLDPDGKRRYIFMQMNQSVKGEWIRNP
jgi:late competence protein required for DNA uptake (superfamily II DNA/RNA helicase)